VATLLALTAPLATALPTTWAVSSCSDAASGNLAAHTGSLRFAVANAASGDTVDASALGAVCSTITLKTGDIVVNQDDLTIVGPGRDALTITAAYRSGSTQHQYKNRIFTHHGSGTLFLQSLRVTSGYVDVPTGNAFGGCVYSNGKVQMYAATADACSAVTSIGQAEGGAVFAQGAVQLISSTVSNNVTDGGTGAAYGGGIRAGNGFIATQSSITGNSARNTVGGQPLHDAAGGVMAYGYVQMEYSVVADNRATANAGGMVLNGSHASSAHVATIANSTVSDNRAVYGYIGGIAAIAESVNVYNSTIAFNTAASTGAGTRAAGLHIYAGSPAAKLESTIVSNNLYGSLQRANDLTAPGVTITGANNLVYASGATLPKAGLIQGKCPLLGPLRDNGGPTPTRALFSHSPAIDAGDNTAFGFHEDQRAAQFDGAPYPYPRVSGAAADIGAYEVQRGDIVFNAGFDGCP
jgi:hypothetical protein